LNTFVNKVIQHSESFPWNHHAVAAKHIKHGGQIEKSDFSANFLLQSDLLQLEVSVQLRPRSVQNEWLGSDGFTNQRHMVLLNVLTATENALIDFTNQHLNEVNVGPWLSESVLGILFVFEAILYLWTILQRVQHNVERLIQRNEV
jgi:hypothetical protein